MKKAKIFKHYLGIRLTDEQYEAFQELKKSGYRISDLIRQSLEFYQSMNTKKDITA